MWSHPLWAQLCGAKFYRKYPPQKKFSEKLTNLCYFFKYFCEITDLRLSPNFIAHQKHLYLSKSKENWENLHLDMTPFHQKRPSHKLLCCTCTLPNMYLPNPKYVSAKYVNAKSQILNLQNMHTFAQYLSANHTPSQFKHIRKTCFCLVLAKRSS